MIDEKIITRIRKMIALRDNHAATQGEIQNATTLVQEMLFRHNLTIEQITDEPGDYSRTGFDPEQPKREGEWIPQLYNMIANYHFCFVVVHPKYDNSKDRKHLSYLINIIGKKQDVEVTEYLCSWLIPKIRQLANNSWAAYKGSEKQGKFKRGYFMGCVMGMGYKLALEKQRLAQESEESTALVLKSEIKLKEAVSKIYPNLSHQRTQGTSSQDGKTSGFVDGKNLSLNKGIQSKREGYIE